MEGAAHTVVRSFDPWSNDLGVEELCTPTTELLEPIASLPHVDYRNFSRLWALHCVIKAKWTFEEFRDLCDSEPGDRAHSWSRLAHEAATVAYPSRHVLGSSQLLHLAGETLHAR